MKRLVLVDRTVDPVADGTRRLPERMREIRAAIVAQLDDDTAGLAATAARLLDQSLGKTARDSFTPFAADLESDGYLIFDCSGCEDGSASIMIR